MTSRQIQLVKESWAFVVPIADAAGQLFYSRLFEVAPGVRHLFKSETKDQAKKLVMMLSMIVYKLDALDTIVDHLQGLAKRHDSYGAKEAHYAVVGDCLIWTLQNGLGDKWNKETEEAWITAYTILSNAMISSQKFETAEVAC